jgi:hypothetical protein
MGFHLLPSTLLREFSSSRVHISSNNEVTLNCFQHHLPNQYTIETHAVCMSPLLGDSVSMQRLDVVLVYTESG